MPGFVPRAPAAHATQSSSSPARYFPKAVSTPVSCNDLATMEQFRQLADERAHHGFDSMATPPKHTFSIEPPETPDDVPLIQVTWGDSSAAGGTTSEENRMPDGAEPSTPSRVQQSPAKGYPTPEPITNPYTPKAKRRSWKPHWGDGLLAEPKRSRCPKLLSVIIAVLLLLLVLLIGVTIGHFVTPYIRTMTLMGTPAPAPGMDIIPANSIDPTGGKDGSSIEGVGLGIETDSSSAIPTDGPPVSPTKNPFLDHDRQGAGTATLTPGSIGP